MIAAFQPEVMAIEELYSHYAAADGDLMGHARGGFAWRPPRRDRGPPLLATGQKHLTGSGRASKGQVRAIQRNSGLLTLPEPPTRPMPWRLPSATIILRDSGCQAPLSGCHLDYEDHGKTGPLQDDRAILELTPSSTRC